MRISKSTCEAAANSAHAACTEGVDDVNLAHPGNLELFLYIRCVGSGLLNDEQGSGWALFMPACIAAVHARGPALHWAHGDVMCFMLQGAAHVRGAGERGLRVRPEEPNAALAEESTAEVSAHTPRSLVLSTLRPIASTSQASGWKLPWNHHHRLPEAMRPCTHTHTHARTHACSHAPLQPAQCSHQDCNQGGAKILLKSKS